MLYGDELYLSGQNQKTGDYSGIMKWDGDQWFTLGAGVDGVITTIQSFQGKLYIGGRFNRAIGQPKTNFTIWQGN